MTTNKPLSAEELLPCPLCEKHALPMSQKIPHPVYWIECAICRCKSGRHFTQADARKAWNTRVQVQQAAPVCAGGANTDGYCYGCGKQDCPANTQPAAQPQTREGGDVASFEKAAFDLALKVRNSRGPIGHTMSIGDASDAICSFAIAYAQQEVAAVLANLAAQPAPSVQPLEIATRQSHAAADLTDDDAERLEKVLADTHTSVLADFAEYVAKIFPDVESLNGVCRDLGTRARAALAATAPADAEWQDISTVRAGKVFWMGNATNVALGIWDAYAEKYTDINDAPLGFIPTHWQEHKVPAAPAHDGKGGAK